jgi:nucleoporin SEH1
LIASGSSDGIVRVFEVHTEWADSGNKMTGADKAASRPLSGRVAGPRISTQSGIGSALANRTPAMPADRQRSGEGPFKHFFDEVAVIDTKHLDVWQVEFSHAGECLS